MPEPQGSTRGYKAQLPVPLNKQSNVLKKTHKAVEKDASSHQKSNAARKNTFQQLANATGCTFLKGHRTHTSLHSTADTRRKRGVEISMCFPHPSPHSFQLCPSIPVCVGHSTAQPMAKQAVRRFKRSGDTGEIRIQLSVCSSDSIAHSPTAGPAELTCPSATDSCKS